MQLAKELGLEQKSHGESANRHHGTLDSRVNVVTWLAIEVRAVTEIFETRGAEAASIGARPHRRFERNADR